MKLLALSLLVFLNLNAQLAPTYRGTNNLDTLEIQSGTIKEVYSVIKDTEIKQGNYEMYYNNKLLCKGFYHHNQKHGPWVKYYPNGQISTQGVYSNSKKNGLWKFVYQNNQLASISQFDKGLPTGKWIGLYMNGDTSCVIQYFINNKDSITKKTTMYYQKKAGHHKQPMIKHREIIVKSFFGKEINEVNLYYYNGQLYKHSFYFDNELDGLYSTFYENGKQWEEMSYEKGKLIRVNYIKSPYGDVMTNHFTNGTGTVNFYNCDGALESKIEFKDGVKHGKAIYYYHGKQTNNAKRAEGEFANGKKIGKWKYYKENSFNKLDRTITYNDDFYSKLVQELSGGNKKYADLLFSEYNGKVEEYNAYHELLSQYTYFNGVRHGAYMNNKGVLTEKGEYYFGSKINKVAYYRGDKIRKSDVIVNDIVIDSSFFQVDSTLSEPFYRTSKYKYKSHYLLASFYGGLENESEHITFYLHDSDAAKANNVQGSVQVEITINGFGKATTKLIKGIGYGCDEEVLRIINLMPLFEPALFRGFPVESKLIRTIHFPIPTNKNNRYSDFYKYVYRVNSRQWMNTLVYN